MEILIISGLSGGGKSKAASFLEDMGFYIVDNMPAGMIMKFAEFCAAGNGRYSRVALVYDVRTADTFDEFLEVLNTLRQQKYNCRLLFLEAEVDAIIKRYKEPRRLHPLDLLALGLLGHCFHGHASLFSVFSSGSPDASSAWADASSPPSSFLACWRYSAALASSTWSWRLISSHSNWKGQS